MIDNLQPQSHSGFMRLNQILEEYPVGKSTWWAGVKSGRFPPPYILGPRTTAWKREDIQALLDSVNKGGK